MKYLTMLALAIAALSLAACAEKETMHHSSASTTATTGYSK